MKFISGVVAAILFMGSIMPGINFSELAKLPHLIEHYALHDNNAHGTLSFFDFLEMHYGSGKEKHTDEHQDKGCLPLQQPVINGGVVFIFTGGIQVPANKLLSQPTPQSYYLAPTSVPAINSFWHPPKA